MRQTPTSASKPKELAMLSIRSLTAWWPQLRPHQVLYKQKKTACQIKRWWKGGAMLRGAVILNDWLVVTPYQDCE